MFNMRCGRVMSGCPRAGYVGRGGVGMNWQTATTFLRFERVGSRKGLAACLVSSRERVVLTRKRGACREEEEGWVDDLLGRGRTGGSFLEAGGGGGVLLLCIIWTRKLTRCWWVLQHANRCGTPPTPSQPRVSPTTTARPPPRSRAFVFHELRRGLRGLLPRRAGSLLHSRKDVGGIVCASHCYELCASHCN